MKKTSESEPTVDLVGSARFACYLPIAALILGQITAFLDRLSTKGNPSKLYYFSLDLWNLALLAFPIIGIVWGVVAWRRTSGKLAVIINAVFLVYAWAYPHHVPAGF